jgi:hypothetical protein
VIDYAHNINQITSVDCIWPLVDITASNYAIWALRYDGRLLVRANLRQCSIGIDWIEIELIFQLII